MKKIFMLLIMLLPSFLFADDFDTYLKKFFSDSTFQKDHVIYPLQGHYTFICDSDPGGTCPKDTVFANKKDEWIYLGYGYGTSPNVTYKKSNKCPEKLQDEKECIYIELEEPGTCFNLQLSFKKIENSWKLIYIWEFVL